MNRLHSRSLRHLRATAFTNHTIVDGEKVAGPTSEWEDPTFEVNGIKTPFIGTWRVVSGDGMVAEDQFYVEPWDCDSGG